MARLTRLRRLAKVQQSSMAVYCIEPRDKLVDQGAVNDSFRMADDSQEPRSSRDSLGSGGLYSEQPPCITAANFRAIGVADCDVIEPLRRKARILERIVNREQDTVSANRLPLISSPGLRASPSLTGYGRVARDRPRVSHWPAESSANDVAAIGDVSAPTPSWYTPKPMEFHCAARRKALSLRQTWWRL
jgi:hypothetical protein